MAQVCEACKKKEAEATDIATTSNIKIPYIKDTTQRGGLSSARL